MTRTLDRILPTYHHHESHTRHVAASPADDPNTPATDPPATRSPVTG